MPQEGEEEVLVAGVRVGGEGDVRGEGDNGSSGGKKCQRTEENHESNGEESCLRTEDTFPSEVEKDTDEPKLNGETVVNGKSEMKEVERRVRRKVPRHRRTWESPDCSCSKEVQHLHLHLHLHLHHSCQSAPF